MSSLTSNQANHNKRDVVNFITLRLARQEDERAVGDLLVRSFSLTYANKLPHIETNRDRELELHDVASRRQEGAVYVLELGYRVIGTFTLIKPDANSTQSWIAGTANLRCVALDPEFHGYGLSEVMLKESEKLARKWKARGICLHVQRGAEGVARLYSNFGYRRDNRGDMESMGNAIEGYYLACQENYATASDLERTG